jgi:hypothetical protein
MDIALDFYTYIFEQYFFVLLQSTTYNMSIPCKDITEFCFFILHSRLRLGASVPGLHFENWSYASALI